MEDKSTELNNYTKRLESLQQTLINNNDIEDIFGDGKSLVNNEVIPITHNFSDQLYMRQMKMPADTFVTTNGETIEHIAPCYEISIKGAKRLIHCLEDCIFINVHKNPTNTKDMDKIEKFLYSFTIEEFNKKEKLCQE